MVLVVKNSPVNVGDVGDRGLIPGWRRSPGVGNGNPLQRSCLENPLDRGTWQAIVLKLYSLKLSCNHGVAKGRTRLSDLAYCT